VVGVTRGVRATLLVGAALMAAGCALPWGRIWTLASGEVVTAYGFGHGAEVVLPLALLIAVAAVSGRRWAAVGLAGLALGCVVYAGLVLPGDLHDASVAGESGVFASLGTGSWRAATAGGWTFAFYGALVACAGAVWIVAGRALQATPPAGAPAAASERV
jgi:hypothetical protein